MVMKNEKREIGVESLVTNNSAARQRGNFRGDASYPFILSRHPDATIRKCKKKEIMSSFLRCNFITVFNFMVILCYKIMIKGLKYVGKYFAKFSREI